MSEPILETIAARRDKALDDARVAYLALLSQTMEGQKIDPGKADKILQAAGIRLATFESDIARRKQIVELRQLASEKPQRSQASTDAQKARRDYIAAHVESEKAFRAEATRLMQEEDTASNRMQAACQAAAALPGLLEQAEESEGTDSQAADRPGR